MQGTYVAIEFGETSNKNLMKFFENLGVKNIVDDLHVTLIYSRETMLFDEIDLNLKGELIRFDNARYELFGEDNDVLVLRFDSKLLTSAHEKIKKLGAIHSYPNYSPYMTIAYDTKEIPSKMLPIKLRTHEIAKVIWEEINDD